MNEGKAPAGGDARLGILFVHGIGDQPQGMTLVQFAEPIVRWIERRSESLARRLLNAGITYTEITRWQDAVSAEWATSGRDDFLRWKPLLWRFQLDAYLDSKANDAASRNLRRMPQRLSHPDQPTSALWSKNTRSGSRLWSPEPRLRTAICDPEWRLLPTHGSS